LRWTSACKRTSRPSSTDRSLPLYRPCECPVSGPIPTSAPGAKQTEPARRARGSSPRTSPTSPVDAGRSKTQSFFGGREKIFRRFLLRGQRLRTFRPTPSNDSRGAERLFVQRRSSTGVVVRVRKAKPRAGVCAQRDVARATASAPAGSRIGQAGSVAARHTASETSREWVIRSPDCWKRRKTCAARSV